MIAEIQNLVPLLLGGIGTGLGIFNTWRQWERDEVKLIVTLSSEPWGGRLGKAVTVHSVRVENRSNFAVTIDDVGLVFKRSGAPKITFSQTVRDGEDTSTKPLPIRVEAREAITLTNDGSELDSDFLKFDLRHLYVRTACGVVKNVTNPMAVNLGK